MRTSIIIPAHNRAENLACTLKALSLQGGSHEVEIIVVDDRSTDNTADVVAQYPAVKYVKVDAKHTTWNASIPRNLGVKMAGGDLLWFLDSDVLIPYPDGVEKTIQAFLQGDHTRALIGSYHWLPPQTVGVDDIRVRFPDVIAGHMPAKHIERKGMVNMKDIRKLSFDKAQSSQDMFSSFTDALACFGGYLLMTKATFWAAGGYDETMLAGVEDGDFGITLYEMGVRFSYLKEVEGYHLAHEQPQGRDPRMIAQQVEKLNHKHHVDMIHQSGKAYRQWGISWSPPPEFYNNDPVQLEKYKKLWQESPMEFLLKINKVNDKKE